MIEFLDEDKKLDEYPSGLLYWDFEMCENFEECASPDRKRQFKVKIITHFKSWCELLKLIKSNLYISFSGKIYIS